MCCLFYPKNAYELIKTRNLAFDVHIEDLCKKMIVMVLVFLEELNPLFLKIVF